MKKIILILMCVIFLMVLVNAEQTIYVTNEPAFYAKLNQDIDIRIPCFDNNNSICTSGDNCQISVQYPNGTIFIKNDSMNYDTGYFNKSILATRNREIGEHPVIVSCQGDANSFTRFYYIVNLHGKAEPSGALMAIAMILFIILFSGFIIYLFVVIGHFATMDVDVMDVAFSFCLYFAILTMYGLNLTYVGSQLIDSILDWTIYVGAITHIFLPLIAFILSLTIGNLRYKKYLQENE